MPYTPGGQWIDFEVARAQREAAATAAIERSRRTGLPEQRFKMIGDSVALVRHGGIGDLLMITPLIRTLAQRGMAVDVVTSRRHRCLFDGNPYVRSVVRCSPSQFEYDPYCWDCWADLHACSESECYPAHQSASFAALCGVELDDLRQDYIVTGAERAWACDKLQEALSEGARSSDQSDSAVIGFVWEAMAGNRSWTAEQNEAAIGALTEAGYRVVILGEGSRQGITDGAGTAETGPIGCSPGADFRGRTSLREAAAIISVCDAVVSPDTGLFHIAGAVGTPVAGFFGPFPIAERSSSKCAIELTVAGHCQHAPCRRHSCGFTRDDGSAPCLTTTTERLVETVARLTGRA